MVPPAGIEPATFGLQTCGYSGFYEHLVNKFNCLPMRIFSRAASVPLLRQSPILRTAISPCLSITGKAPQFMARPSDLQKVMSGMRAILRACGPASATAQNELATQATVFVKDKHRSVRLAEQLAVAIGFHHTLAEMNKNAVGPCREALSIVGEIQADRG
jgi:hypothetical protein